MLKKYLVLALIFILQAGLYAQKGDSNYEEELPALYGLHGELGYGGAGLSAGLGFRYDFVSLSIGLSGFANSIPNYASYKADGINLTTNPLPDGYTEESYEAIIVTFDAAYNYEFEIGTAYAGIGFFAQTDTVLAKEVSTGDYFRRGTINSSGICFNLGFDYYWSENVGVGLGFHSKKGIMARFSYYWW